MKSAKNSITLLSQNEVCVTKLVEHLKVLTFNMKHTPAVTQD